MTTDPVGQSNREVEASRWDDTSDERERLADERERLADERERLADERERLADHGERNADRVGADADADASLANAQDQLLRAEARVQRALAEQERAQAAVERASLGDARARAAAERESSAAASGELDDEEATWAWERRQFVAAERDRLAVGREGAADARDDLARLREQEADARDRASRHREEIAAQRTADLTGAAGALDKPTDRARRDLAAVREAGRRQRAAAAASRRQAAADRTEASRRGAAAGARYDPEGGSLAAQFTALTRELFSSQDVLAVAARVVDLAVECIPGAVASGVTLFEGVRPMTQVTSDDVARQLDAYQLLAPEGGPICEALENAEPVSIPDLAADARWPSLRSMAAELGVYGIGACCLTVRRDHDWQPLGALTVYSEAPGAFDDDVGDAVSLFAAHLAVAAAFDRDRHDVSRREAALHRALGSRDVIGQAKGILMERRHIPAGEAFDILRRTSQRLNVRLQELATRLTETGELPE